MTALRLLLSLIALLAVGCGSLPQNHINVPWMPQTPGLCGVDALQMVLAHHGSTSDRAALTQEAYVPVLGGSTPALLVQAARLEGFIAHEQACELEEMADWLAQGWPPIAFWGPQETDKIGHFVVVTGIDLDKGRVLVHSGSRHNQSVKINEFSDLWTKGGSVSILVRPLDTSLAAAP